MIVRTYAAIHRGQQLPDTAEQLRAILECAPAGINVYDREGHFLESNAAFQRISGYSQEELKGKTLFDLAHPDDQAGTRERIEDLLSGKIQSYEVEQRYVRKDGHTIWVHVACSGISPRYIVGIVQDITESREAAGQLRATAERLRAILNHASLGIVIQDKEGCLIECNAAQQRITGYSEEELKGAKFADYTHPEDLGRNLELFESVKSSKLPSLEIEKRYVPKDGQVIWVRAIGSRLNENLKFSFLTTAHGLLLMRIFSNAYVPKPRLAAICK